MPVADEPNFQALREATIALREAKGLSLRQLHFDTGIARSMLFRIENGTASGSLATWYRIAKALDVPLGDLVSSLETVNPEADGSQASAASPH